MNFTTSVTGGLAVALLSSALATAPAFADEPKKDLQITGNVAGTTQYVFRGFSQTAEKWAVQGGVDLTYKWFYAGVWASNLDFGKDPLFQNKGVANVEVDYYVGIKPVVGKLTFDFGAIYYTYPRAFDIGAPAAFRELDYLELKAGFSAEAWKDGTVGLTVFYSPEGTNKTGTVWTVEGTIAQVLPKLHTITPTFGATVGYQTGDDARYRALVGNGSDSYLYWNVGMTLGFHDRFSLDFRYWDTDVKSNNAAGGFADGFCTGRTFGCAERFVATAKITY